MRDLYWGRKINVMTASSLAFVLLGCGMVEDEEEPTLEEEFCQISEECDPANFNAEFDSLRECENYIEEQFDVLEDNSRACGNAAEDYLECFNRSYRRVCNVEATMQTCGTEVEALAENCLYDEYSYDY